MKKEYMIDLAGIILFYSIIVLGIIALDARMEQLNNINNNATFVR